MKRELSMIKQQQEKNNRHLKATRRQLDYYFLNYHFLLGGTNNIFGDCEITLTFETSNICFSETLRLLCYILKNGAEDSTISFHSEFYFLLKTAYSARPMCANLKQNFLREFLLLQVFDYNFLFIDSRPCPTF